MGRAAALAPALSLAWLVACSAPDRQPSTPTEVDLGPASTSVHVVAPPDDGPAVGSTEHGGASNCLCGVLDFESDGPPKGQCVVRHADFGPVVIESKEGKPPFRAQLRPKDERRPGERAHYAYTGVFDFACEHAWCGRRELDVLELEPYDLRVVVERSDDGPPSHVLWVSCGSDVPPRR